MRNRMMGLLIGALLLFSIFYVPGMLVASASSVSLSFDSESYTAFRDKEFTVTVVLNTTVKLGALQFNVTWNPEYLELVNYSEGAVMSSAMSTLNNGSGFINVGLISVSGVSSGDVMKLTFKAKKEGTTNLNIIIVDASDPLGTNVNVAPGTATVIVKKGIIANFTYSPVEPAVGQEVSFDASLSQALEGSITSYAWDFGDNTSAEGMKVSHKYIRPGVYNVTLTVAGDAGTDTLTKQVTVVNHPPEIKEVSCKVVDEELGRVECSAKVDDPDVKYGVDSIKKYVWNFGDGSEVEGNETITHDYTDGGTYTVALTVYDSFGGHDDSSTTVTVHPLKTVEVSNTSGKTFEYPIVANYSELPPKYTNAFQYVNESVFEYITGSVLLEVLNESDSFIEKLQNESLSSVERKELGTPVWKIIGDNLSKDSGLWNLTILWQRTSTVVGMDKNNENKIRLSIFENRTIILRVSFPDIREENAPRMIIVSPEETVYNTTMIEFKVNVTDESGFSVKAYLNGKAVGLYYNSTSQMFENSTVPLGNGSYCFKVFARDEYGNLGVASVHFVAHESIEVQRIENVTVGVIGNASVALENDTVLVNVTVGETTIPVEIPVDNVTTSVVVNTTAVEEVVKSSEPNVTLVGGWNAQIEEYNISEKETRTEITANVSVGENGVAVIAVKLKYGVNVTVKVTKENGTVVILKENDRASDVGYYYIVNKVAFVVLKQDPEMELIDTPPKKKATPEAMGGISITTLNFIGYRYYHMYNEQFEELYQKVVEMNVSNETLQRALQLHNEAAEYYKQVEEIIGSDTIFDHLADIRILAPLRKAYLAEMRAVKLLKEALEELEAEG